jgi:hypothetical protein
LIFVKTHKNFFLAKTVMPIDKENLFFGAKLLFSALLTKVYKGQMYSFEISIKRMIF